MAIECEDIINWLKTYFKPRNEDYNYDITASNYNPNIDSNVTITITVTDGNDDPVTDHSFTLNANGTDVSLTTNSSGVATYTYTCSNWGLHTFNTPSSNIQIRITGWKTFYHNDDYTVTYNENDLVSFQVHNSNSYALTTSWKEFGYTWLTDAFRPVNPVKFFTGDNIICAISDNSSTIKFRSLSGNVTSQLWGHAIYKRKG